MRRRNWRVSGTIAIFIAWMAVQVLPKSVYGGLTRLIPIEGIPDSALILLLTAVIAALVYLAFVAATLLWESRSGAASASSGDLPGDDSQREG